MASHKSALKSITQINNRTEENRVHTARLRNQIRKFRAALNSKYKAATLALLKPTLTLIDHSVHKGILHANTAARYKSRLTIAYNALA